MQVEFYVRMGLAGCIYEEIEDFPDDVTEKELEEYAHDLMTDWVNYGFKVIE